jgi:hypothetical protein
MKKKNTTENICQLETKENEIRKPDRPSEQWRREKVMCHNDDSRRQAKRTIWEEEPKKLEERQRCNRTETEGEIGREL